VTIRKAGRPTVRSTGRTLEFVVPIAVEGRVGVPGELARSLGFDARAFRGAMDAIARVSADLDRNWCPRLTAEGDFRWTDRAQLEIVDGYWIDIDQPAGLELRRRIEQGIAALDGLVTCAMVRDAIASEWREIDLALPVPDMGEDLAHLHFRPTGAGFSGIDYGQEAIAAAIQIDGVTELRTGAPPATARRLDLPPLERIDATANRIDINLPVRLGYDRLVAELNSQFAGRTFTGRTPAGEARVTVEEVTLYPSGDRLAAGLRFTAGHDSRALSASGWAYLAARPVLSDDGRTIRLEDVALTRQLDNDLWSLLSGIFNDQIAAQIARSAVFPLDDAIATAKRQLGRRARSSSKAKPASAWRWRTPTSPLPRSFPLPRRWKPSPGSGHAPRSRSSRSASRPAKQVARPSRRCYRIPENHLQENRNMPSAPNTYDAEPIPTAARAEVERLLASGDLFRYTAPGDTPVALLERDFADFIGSKYALAVASCSAALFLSMKALGLPRGARVLVPAFTFAAVPSSVLHADCTPVLVEVGEDYRIDLDDFAAKLPGADAVLISHMRGHTSDMDAIMALADAAGLPVIEDAAHSLGTTWHGRNIGTIGRIGCFSFQSYKLLNAGEGGILVTDDADLMARAVIMSGAYEHNWKKHPVLQDAFARWQNRLPLYNTRLNNLSAAILRPQIAEVPRRVRDGRRNHDQVAARLGTSPWLSVPRKLAPEERAPIRSSSTCAACPRTRRAPSPRKRRSAASRSRSSACPRTTPVPSGTGGSSDPSPTCPGPAPCSCAPATRGSPPASRRPTATSSPTRSSTPFGQSWDQSTRRLSPNHGIRARHGATISSARRGFSRSATRPGMSSRTSRRAVSEIARLSGAKGRGSTSARSRKRPARMKPSGVRMLHPAPSATIAMIA
jgi:dTDP-4-amino-4,6-dideoxygalactose transaminase